MAGFCRVGRPYRVAVIDFSDDPVLDWYENFFDACASLTYNDMVILGRTLGINEKTIYNWKQGVTFPNKPELAQRLINWVNEGKPEMLVTQASAATGVI